MIFCVILRHKAPFQKLKSNLLILFTAVNSIVFCFFPQYGAVDNSYALFFIIELDGSLSANPVNDRRVANAVTLKSTFCLP